MSGPESGLVPVPPQVATPVPGADVTAGGADRSDVVAAWNVPLPLDVMAAALYDPHVGLLPEDLSTDEGVRSWLAASVVMDGMISLEQRAKELARQARVDRPEWLAYCRQRAAEAMGAGAGRPGWLAYCHERVPPERELRGRLMSKTQASVTPLRPGGGVATASAPAGDVRLYRVPEAMRVLGLSRSVIYEQMRSGRLQSVHQGRTRLIPAEAIADYVTLLKSEASPNVTPMRSRRGGGR